jgi:23S rRNA (uracil1939-C5)-methyltransferase
VGAIGLSLLDRATTLCLNEVSPHSLSGLRLGLDQLSEADRAKISLVPGPAGEACGAARGASVVIADPPRKGLDPELIEFLKEHPPERFFYVSCGLASFLHDAERLTDRGALRLQALSAFNLMPFTEHVETVARFERV